MTLAQLREQLLSLLRETAGDTNFTPDQLNAFINQAMQQAAVIIEYPRDRVQVTVEKGIGAYTLPSDALSIVMGYFGNPQVARDMRKVEYLTEQTLSEMFPSWLNETDDDLGRPHYYTKPDRNTVFLYPRPDVDNSNGKVLILVYVYTPSSMTNDAQEPPLPIAYQNILKYYAAHLCYVNLGNNAKADALRNTFFDEHKRIELASTKEVSDLAWQWGFDDGQERDLDVTLIP